MGGLTSRGKTDVGAPDTRPRMPSQRVPRQLSLGIVARLTSPCVLSSFLLTEVEVWVSLGPNPTWSPFKYSPGGKTQLPTFAEVN